MPRHTRNSFRSGVCGRLHEDSKRRRRDLGRGAMTHLGTLLRTGFLSCAVRPRPHHRCSRADDEGKTNYSSESSVRNVFCHGKIPSEKNRAGLSIHFFMYANQRRHVFWWGTKRIVTLLYNLLLFTLFVA